MTCVSDVLHYISTNAGLKNKRMTDPYPSLTGNITEGKQSNGNDEHTKSFLKANPLNKVPIPSRKVFSIMESLFYIS